MTPTAQSMDMSSSTDTAPPSQSSTALLFSMAPPKTRPLTRTSSVDASATDEDEEQRKRVLQLKRRFLKNPSVSSKFFAKRETRKKIAREVSMYSYNQSSVVADSSSLSLEPLAGAEVVVISPLVASSCLSSNIIPLVNMSQHAATAMATSVIPVGSCMLTVLALATEDGCSCRRWLVKHISYRMVEKNTILLYRTVRRIPADCPPVEGKSV